MSRARLFIFVEEGWKRRKEPRVGHAYIVTTYLVPTKEDSDFFGSEILSMWPFSSFGPLMCLLTSMKDRVVGKIRGR